MLKNDIQSINYENGEKDIFNETMTQTQKKTYNCAPKTGLKGFIEGGYTIRMGSYSKNRLALQAVVGYQNKISKKNAGGLTIKIGLEF